MRTDANHKAWDNWLTWYFKILYNELKQSPSGLKKIIGENGPRKGRTAVKRVVQNCVLSLGGYTDFANPYRHPKTPAPGVNSL